MAKNSRITFEQAAGRIEEIVRLLEKGDAPLDQSLALFEEGTRLISVAGKMLDDAEQKVVRMQKGADGEPRERVFDEDE
ncbi:MAG: exodeoxyribonuclease VII small subunit [Oscillospiraceae bacterium]|nr:exodeoxyribonuclease VII small subunit [Oscillospiraceae bacterium]